MKVVFYHTDDKLYSRYAEILERSLSRLNIDFYKKIIPQSSWVHAVSGKAEFLLECRELFEGDILYIDADAFVHEDFRVELGKLDCDIAFCKYRDYITGRHGNLSGTILLKDTANTRSLLKLWKEKSELDKKRWDQATLTEALEESPDLKVKDLGYRYTYIFDNPNCLRECSTPIIEHLQASRLSDKKRKWFHRFLNKKSKRATRTLKRTDKILSILDK